MARELAAGDVTLTITAEALLAARAALATQIARLDKLLPTKRLRIQPVKG